MSHSSTGTIGETEIEKFITHTAYLEGPGGARSMEGAERGRTRAQAFVRVHG